MATQEPSGLSGVEIKIHLDASRIENHEQRVIFLDLVTETERNHMIQLCAPKELGFSSRPGSVMEFENYEDRIRRAMNNMDFMNCTDFEVSQDALNSCAGEIASYFIEKALKLGDDVGFLLKATMEIVFEEDYSPYVGTENGDDDLECLDSMSENGYAHDEGTIDERADEDEDDAAGDYDEDEDDMMDAYGERVVVDVMHEGEDLDSYNQRALAARVERLEIIINAQADYLAERVVVDVMHEGEDLDSYNQRALAARVERLEIIINAQADYLAERVVVDVMHEGEDLDSYNQRALAARVDRLENIIDAQAERGLTDDVFMDYADQSSSRTNGASVEVIDDLVKNGKVDGQSVKGDTCSVCLEEFSDLSTDVMKTSCSHLFHSSCISEWLQTSNSCPLCRNLFQ